MGATLHRRPEDALAAIAGDGQSVLLVDLDDVADGAWAPLEAAGLRLLRVADADAALHALAQREAQGVIPHPRGGPAVARSGRSRPDVDGAHIVVSPRPGSPPDLSKAL